MSELAFRDGIMDRIRMREQRFDERAYLFVLGALEYCQQRLPERRHITGRELALACRDLALERFGPMAKTVFEQWGIAITEDFGHIVFQLVDEGLLGKTEQDKLSDFARGYDFNEAFVQNFDWLGRITDSSDAT